MLAGTNTRERILDAEERLFAAHGFAGTSLRAVTRKAEVNLAAVHYNYFRS
jgi:AcrR family transcriptional regulator